MKFFACKTRDDTLLGGFCCAASLFARDTICSARSLTSGCPIMPMPQLLSK
jgi:hypothetical protein